VNVFTAVVRRSMSVAQSYAVRQAAGTQNSLVRITRAGAFNAAAGEYDPSAEQVIYDDPAFPGFGAQAGVTASSGPVTMGFGDEPEYYENLTVYLPKALTTKPRIDDLLQYMAGPDTNLVTRFFRVVSVESGGRLVPSTELRCMGISPSKQWAAS
jgi:hypothetical protein